MKFLKNRDWQIGLFLGEAGHTLLEPLRVLAALHVCRLLWSMVGAQKETEDIPGQTRRGFVILGARNRDSDFNDNPQTERLLSTRLSPLPTFSHVTRTQPCARGWGTHFTDQDTEPEEEE